MYEILINLDLISINFNLFKIVIKYYLLSLVYIFKYVIDLLLSHSVKKNSGQNSNGCSLGEGKPRCSTFWVFEGLINLFASIGLIAITVNRNRLSSCDIIAIATLANADITCTDSLHTCDGNATFIVVHQIDEVQPLEILQVLDQDHLPWLELKLLEWLWSSCVILHFVYF